MRLNVLVLVLLFCALLQLTVAPLRDGEQWSQPAVHRRDVVPRGRRRRRRDLAARQRPHVARPPLNPENAMTDWIDVALRTVLAMATFGVISIGFGLSVGYANVRLVRRRRRRWDR